jgi:hypothetical protein
MWCPQCGSSNDDSAAFCKTCGADLAKIRQQWQEPAGTGQGQPSYQQPAQPPSYQTQPPYQQQYQPTYQAPQYGAKPYGAVPRVSSYMGWAIAVLILFFWPTGIAAVVNASRVSSRLAVGDVAGAQEASRKAKMWCWITFAIGVVLAVIVGLAYYYAADRVVDIYNY